MLTKNNKFGFVAFLLLALWGVIFSDSLVAMESIWRRSDTFAHGYFILPIVLWLFWRDKAYLLNSKTQTSWLALPFVFGSLMVSLFSYAADINVLSQLSAITCLISLIWLMLGNKLTWHYKFPLAYLIFLVPMGETLIPDLQDITAWFTVAFLKLNGIPVFRDGLYIQVPNGLFEVAVACSGIRYLIASLAVGTLFAHLSYQSVKKQVLFFLFALFLPILANGIRAYLIVIIAYYSDMEYATGADHLVYGWVFFGFIIMLMFWIGGKFSDPELSNEQSKANAIKEQSRSAFSVLATLTAIALLIGTQGLKLTVPVVASPMEIKTAIKELPEVHQSNWGITFKYPLMRSHVETNNSIEIFRSVYANKQTNGELINHANRLYDHDKWTVVDRIAFEINDHKAKYLLLRSTLGTERVVVYWYQVADEVVLEPSVVKLKQALALFLNPASYSAVTAYSMAGTQELGELLEQIKMEIKQSENNFVDEQRALGN